MGKEVVSTSSIKDRFVHVTYMVLYERHPMHIEFEFYRPKNDWVIYAFSFDGDFDKEIQATARAQAAAGKGL